MSASPPSRPGLRGAVLWAFTAFQPEAPFELVDVEGDDRLYPDAPAVARAIKDGELTQAPKFKVAAKLRPLVVLQDRPRGVLPEYAALKLTRFTKLDAGDQQRVRDGLEPALFHLPLNRGKYGLTQENAIDLNSLVRIHQSAIVTSPVGRLDENEIDVLGRRLTRFLDIDLEPAIREGVIERWEALVAAQRARRRP
ncbi:MAG TPA: hypothetical protein VG147_11850 [Solirubrobacteraceae bacterium]|nr:hypothetical protein [Solirubrobacteraceae bacterium]